MALEPVDLAELLRRAGYAQVETPSAPGEFTLSKAGLHAISTAGKQAEVLVTFGTGAVGSDGVVSNGVGTHVVRSTTPTEPVDFGPVPLASVRGRENEERTPRSLGDFPPALRKAVLAMEDDRFFDHGGVSLPGILRALVRNVFSDGPLQGGSTLSQQLAKNLFLTPERTWQRKIRELFLTLALERELDKEEILNLYLNEVYWGQAAGVSICGAAQAARAYFGKPVERLTLGEAATLGGIISAPNTYSPLRHPERAQARRNLALRRMLDERWISEADATAASETPLHTAPIAPGRSAPYAMDSVLEQVESSLGQGAVARNGLSIHTTLHPVLQQQAEQAIEGAMAALQATHPETADAQVALIALSPRDGSIVAMVGGRDYGVSQFNRATQAARQVGSTLKPLTLLAAFESDRELAPSSTLEDAPIERFVNGETWAPTNYDGRFVGEITLRESIARSRNIPAVLLAEQVGLEALADWLHDLGLERARPLPSVSLGAFEASPLELARAYTVFPGRGTLAEPRLLTQVKNADSEVLLEFKPSSRPLASPRAAAMATSVLESVMTQGTGAGAARHGLVQGVGGKSGTTDGGRDAWFVGFTPDLVVAVWVGRDGGEPLGLTGSKAALPPWARFVAASGTAGGAFPLPSTVVEAETCTSGFELGECTECTLEVYTAGTEPIDGCEPPGVLSSIWEIMGNVDPFGQAEDTDQPGEDPPGVRGILQRLRGR